MNKKISLLIIIILILSNCKTRDEFLEEIVEEKSKYDKFKDVYENFKYWNKSLGLIIEFDGDWVIRPHFEYFDDLQKKYSRYFASDQGEVLFVGNNEQKKIGIRCTCENLELENNQYLQKIRTTAGKDINNYKIKFISEKEVILTNIKALHSVFETTINANNIFVFDSILFRYDTKNYKIDMWIKKSLYENQKDYILSVFQTIDFIIEDNYESGTKDNTNDIETIE
ncbi:MAG: hypothetical protein KAT05_08500 [Spirochaetes bacterium]|nr:hypothetical protein [Spirochaetota bacterium]